ncbi:outer membrane beta-barrel protein [uncultured Shimia sp.]|uniref:outer membrane beta-barrel protein n=1 Tax=uncultured Shimia sp. TaxID=573152 RepID=UPI003421D72D
MKYSYDEYGLRFRVKRALRKDLSISGGFAVYQRAYKGPFSALLPIDRDEMRLKAEVEVTKRFSDRITGFARVGWDENESNIFLRDYAGATFGLGVTIHLN